MRVARVSPQRQYELLMECRSSGMTDSQWCIHQKKPRYYRDQLGVIRKLFEEWNKEAVMDGLRYCRERELYSASDLKTSIIYLNQKREAKEIKRPKTVLPSKYRGNNPQKRDLGVYEEAMERGVING